MSQLANDICGQSAVSLRNHIRSKALSAKEVCEAHLQQIAAVNSDVNAICTLLDEELILDQAETIDSALANGENTGSLAGLPIAIKDLVQTRGIRTTMGSPIFKDQVPKADALFVERIRGAGGIVFGKTNTPEFGAGSNTFNPVFGATRNPHNLDKTAGGSSGGAAAALASRMLPIADGSDLGGSLRNPAGFCNVIGFRPSIGRVPIVPNLMGWQSRLAVEGPMARKVEDCALLLKIMAGPDIRDPVSLYSMEELGSALELDPKGVRIGWSPNLGGLPVEAPISNTFEKAAGFFEQLATDVSDTSLDLTDAMDVFRVFRANAMAESTRPFFDENRHLLKDTIIGNVELGRSLSGEDVSRADVARTRIYQRMLSYFEEYDFLVTPTTQVVPFNIETEWVTEVNGVTMSDYIEWMSICCVVTVTGLPAISMPCGFTEHGLPVGLQIIGGPGRDWHVLQMAKAFESITNFADTLPAGLYH